MRFDQESVLRREEELNAKGPRRLAGIWLMLRWMILIAIVGTIAFLCFAVYGGFQAVLDCAPDISNIDVTPTGFSTFVYDSDGNQTARLVSTDSNRIPVTLDMVPTDLQHAFVAIEDARFYEHRGIDIEGILRAGVTGLTSGSFSQGASTITQQLIKNNVFEGWTNETFSESVRRKIQEQYLAVELEKTMSKDDILLNYLNTINLGHNTLGVQAASLRYFGRSVSTLNLSECAVIAGITQNPTKYDPITYPENNNRRRLVVLDRMLDQGYITKEQHDEAAKDN
ncbi:MAG: penicillin-binding protein, partial [Lachnospiraceae bacterium]|nr:penicillin-binding protein [Lachnospiraceae bacterium]